nr:polysaccharide deacetylase family protein [uncultured Carboxylicivirga sp.]
MNSLTKKIIARLLKIKPKGFVYFGHGVCDQLKSEYIEQLHITRRQLVELIEFWKDLGVEFLSMDDLLKMRRSGKSSRKHWIHFTFDDGYRNNLTTLLPVMEEYKIPFTVFVSTGLVEKQEYMPTFYIRSAVMPSQKEWECTKTGLKLTNGMKTRDKQNLADKLCACYKYLPQNEGIDFLNEIKNLLSPDEWSKCKSVYLNDQLMTIDELKSLNNSSLVTIGSHSHSHMIFHEHQSKSDVFYEIKEPKNWLENYLGINTKVMAYPNGTEKDYNAKVVQTVKDAGYQLAFTTHERFISINDEDLLLPRIFFHPKAGSILKEMLKSIL